VDFAASGSLVIRSKYWRVASFVDARRFGASVLPADAMRRESM
jgi:hypothetical protein